MAQVTVDENLCIGCGLCVEICPDVFEMGDDGQAHAVHPEKCPGLPCCADAAESCPVEAIKIE
ncbi:MAG: ferredoxin [Firmicutes bacterium]|nr:ferredoxin [Bacillota bacterium]MDH7496566.1 ferredoxin [Bacillota bacterium]